MDHQLTYQKVVCLNRATFSWYILHCENILTGIKWIKHREKKGFFIKFWHFFYVNISNVANEGSWKSTLNLLYNEHGVPLYSKVRLIISVLFFSPTKIVISENCSFIIPLWSRIMPFKYRITSSSFSRISTVFIRFLGQTNNITFNSLIKGFNRTFSLILYINKGTLLTTFEDRTIKMFSSKTATNGHRKFFCCCCWLDFFSNLYN